MRLKLLEIWRRIRRSFWFLPSLMVAGAIGLAFVNLYLDRLAAAASEGPPPWLAVAGAESARSLLSTIAGSMITVAGVTFSIVIVALTLASSQFGPRMLTGFMQDTGNQVVLGTFVSVFAYCLVVLLHLPGSAGSRLLPQTSILTGVVLAVLSLGVLIFFFHHISTSIQAGELVRAAGHSFESRIRAHLPAQPLGEGEEESWPPPGFSESNARLVARKSGYLSSVDTKLLAELGCEQGFRILAVPRAGDYVLEGEEIALVTPPEALTEDRREEIYGAFAMVLNRGEGADLLLAIDRLTEMAVRALSPGINDPYTARAVLHRLTAGFNELLDRLPATHTVRDGEGSPRFFMRPPDAGDLLELGYGPIRTYGRRDVSVLEAILDCLCRLRRHDRFRPLLLEQADRVAAAGRGHLEMDDERSRIDALYDRVWGQFKT